MCFFQCQFDLGENHWFPGKRSKKTWWVFHIAVNVLSSAPPIVGGVIFLFGFETNGHGMGSIEGGAPPVMFAGL